MKNTLVCALLVVTSGALANNASYQTKDSLIRQAFDCETVALHMVENNLVAAGPEFPILKEKGYRLKASDIVLEKALVIFRDLAQREETGPTLMDPALFQDATISKRTYKSSLSGQAEGYVVDIVTDGDPSMRFYFLVQHAPFFAIEVMRTLSYRVRRNEST